MAEENASIENGSGDLRRSLQLLWGTVPEPTRGPKPGLTLQRIVRAAIEVADAEGIAALSMRRLATALDAGAMSLYRYVPGKAELIDLMMDEVSGEDLAAADADRGDWRSRLEAFARRMWLMYLRHPWMLQISQGRPMLGPNSMASTEIALRYVDGLGLDEKEMMSTIVAIGAYVGGLARTTVEAMQAADRTGISDDDWWAVHTEFLTPAVLEGRTPMLDKVGDAGAFNGDYDIFGFGLERLLDGIAVVVEQRSGGPATPTA